jgi:hypothetical protein
MSVTFFVLSFEIRGGKEGQRPQRLNPNRKGQDQLDLHLLLGAASSQSGGEGRKKRKGDTWASSVVNFSEINFFRLLYASLFSDLPYSSAKMLLPW